MTATTTALPSSKTGRMPRATVGDWAQVVPDAQTTAGYAHPRAGEFGIVVKHVSSRRHLRFADGRVSSVLATNLRACTADEADALDAAAQQQAAKNARAAETAYQLPPPGPLARTLPRVLSNGSQTRSLDLQPALSLRPGAEDYRRLPSRMGDRLTYPHRRKEQLP